MSVVIKKERHGDKVTVIHAYDDSACQAIAQEARNNDEQMFKGEDRLIGVVPKAFLLRARDEGWLHDDAEFKRQLRKYKDGAFLATRHNI